ncbi:hypothetical protein GOV12_03795 [Candidatus Pacearchaeota archaeon]|nr:hypothetical protein [Candidatus Pacearchaeota archaeon]
MEFLNPQPSTGIYTPVNRIELPHLVVFDYDTQLGPKRIIRSKLRSLNRSADDSDLIDKIGKDLFTVNDPTNQDYRPANCCFSFRDVNFMSSGMLGKYITFDERQKSQDQPGLSMAEVIPNISEVFKITHLNELFRFHEDEEDFLI